MLGVWAARFLGLCGSLSSSGPLLVPLVCNQLSLQLPTLEDAVPRGTPQVPTPAVPPTPVPAITQPPLPQARASPEAVGLLATESAAGRHGAVAPEAFALDRAAASVPLPASLRSVRFFDEPSILQAASVGWEAVAQVPFAREKLLNHCPLCFMWHVTGNGNCKKHMNAKHKDHKAAISRLRAECKAERTRFHGQVGLPCTFCNQIIDQPIRHAEGCSVMFGAKFLVHLYEQSGHGRSSGGLGDTTSGLLPAPAPECEPNLAVADGSEGSRDKIALARPQVCFQAHAVASMAYVHSGMATAHKAA